MEGMYQSAEDISVQLFQHLLRRDPLTQHLLVGQPRRLAILDLHQSLLAIADQLLPQQYLDLRRFQPHRGRLRLHQELDKFQVPECFVVKNFLPCC